MAEAKTRRDPATYPARVRLLAPYGYYDADGGPHFWIVGQIVSGEDARTLLDNGAPVEPVAD